MKRLVELIQRSKLQLRWKLLCGFLITNILLIIAPVLVFLLLFDTTGKLKGNSERIQQISQIDTLQNQLVTTTLDYAWTGNLARLNEYTTLQQNLDRTIDVFQPKGLQQDNYVILRQEVAGLEKILRQMLTLSDADLDQDGIEIWRTQGSKQAKRVSSIIRDLSEQEARLNELDYQEITDKTTFTTGLIITFIAISLLLGLGLALLLTAAVTNPLNQLRQRFDKLATGDLSQFLGVANNDELGELSQRYNTTVSSLRLLIAQLYSQSQQLSAATEELNAQARQQVTGSTQQASAVTEVTTITQQLNATAAEIARQTTDGAEAVQLSFEQARKINQLADQMVLAQTTGQATVARTINGLANLRDQMTTIEQNQLVLQEKSTLINRIVNLIDSIAKETHLLALNAGIEAAGAGASGRRFGVIAGEVKSLASRAVGATGEVRSILASLAEAIGEAGDSARQGSIEAEKAVSEAAKAKATFLALTDLGRDVKTAAETILNQVESTVSLAISIESMTKQQQNASDQILNAMFQISAVTTQALNSVKQSEQVTYQINSSANALKQSANTFKIEEQVLRQSQPLTSWDVTALKP